MTNRQLNFENIDKVENLKLHSTRKRNNLKSKTVKRTSLYHLYGTHASVPSGRGVRLSCGNDNRHRMCFSDSYDCESFSTSQGLFL